MRDAFWDRYVMPWFKKKQGNTPVPSCGKRDFRFQGKAPEGNFIESPLMKLEGQQVILAKHSMAWIQSCDCEVDFTSKERQSNGQNYDIQVYGMYLCK